MVRDRFGDYWTGHRRQAGCSLGGAFMTWWSLVLILVWLGTFVAGQLFFKRAMESSGVAGLRNRQTISILSAGILLMTVSFFLNIGLLLCITFSYLYLFYVLYVFIVSFMVAVFC